MPNHGDTDKAGPYACRIRDRLRQALHPEYLEVIDDSHRHAGHQGHDPQGETHFIVKICSPQFAGQPRLERHRQIHALLAAEMKERVHALSIVARAPGEGP